MARRKGRIIAFQALYSWEMGNTDLDNLLSFEWVGEEKLSKMDDDVLTFARLLVSGTIEHLEEIDNAIKANLNENWDFSRLNKVDLAILRISAYPILFQKDIHPSIVIDEAIDISKEFGTDDSFKFINAVLDSIRKAG
ncbi:MAG: transcription antitermination factor NusB [Treponemataceae bacterium]|nr:transcription antitermination factor NusB [Treponemataceae bacterium]